MKYGLAEDAEKKDAPWPRRQSVHVPFGHIFSRMINDTNTERDSRNLFRHRIDMLKAQLAFAETDIDYLLEKIQVLEERHHRDRQKFDEQATRFQQELEDVKRAQDPLSKSRCPNKPQATTPASKSSSPTSTRQASTLLKTPLMRRMPLLPSENSAGAHKPMSKCKMTAQLLSQSNYTPVLRLLFQSQP